MAQLIVRNLDDAIKVALQRRAERSGRSMEAEVRAILEAAVSATRDASLGSRIAERFRDDGLDFPVEEQRGNVALPATLPE